MLGGQQMMERSILKHSGEGNQKQRNARQSKGDSGSAGGKQAGEKGPTGGRRVTWGQRAVRGSSGGLSCEKSHSQTQEQQLPVSLPPRLISTSIPRSAMAKREGGPKHTLTESPSQLS